MNSHDQSGRGVFRRCVKFTRFAWEWWRSVEGLSREPEAGSRLEGAGTGRAWKRSLRDGFDLRRFGPLGLVVAALGVMIGTSTEMMAQLDPVVQVRPSPNYYSAKPQFAAPGPVFNVQYDGMTVLLLAQTWIPAGVTHHVTVAVADYAGEVGAIKKDPGAADYVYDSAVFLTAWPAGECW